MNVGSGGCSAAVALRVKSDLQSLPLVNKEADLWCRSADTVRVSKDSFTEVHALFIT